MTEGPTTAVVVVAAGSGSRLGASVPKAFVRVAGRTLLDRALDPVRALDPAVQVIVVVPAALGLELPEGATSVIGRATRQGSVAAGLALLAPGVRTVLVHDAARAFTPVDQFERVIAAVESTGAGVIPALPVTDTIKLTDAGRALDTVDRSTLVAVQTPQGFPAAQLVAAYAAATSEYTDDAALFAAASHAVSVVTGDADAFKITTPHDLERAQQKADRARRDPTDELPREVSTSSTRFGGFRTGTGVDVHAYDDESPLWLGGLHWPGERGLAGHSDGDALSHAICDALLSAAGLGDLGSRFGTADPRFADAHGDVFLTETVALVAGAGYAIANVAAQVIANAPKVGPRRVELEARLSALVGAPVSVSATTSDHLGFTGRGEGVAVMATALLERTQ
ncbi:MAG: bifunctional 2-C-methyl-D-erythritol 4-phosphate cytidylyltransferase/2-C-methyl-D-erythritol [Microbacteriaceae bacterium]|nr:bifunctional 2-C-methyl-D-erythritol 4-phosphate cytidylyltransferase/2-C-methyl-D-erythritol [Microbacteriaceae bacterium]